MNVVHKTKSENLLKKKDKAVEIQVISKSQSPIKNQREIADLKNKKKIKEMFH